MKLFPNIAFPQVANTRDKYQRRGNQSNRERWEDETFSLHLVKSWRRDWSYLLFPLKYCALFISDKLSMNSKLPITIDTAQGAHSDSLFHLHWHPSSFRRKRMKIPSWPLCLIAVIASVTWWELEQYVCWSKDTLSIRGVWYPSRLTTETVPPKGVSVGRRCKMQSCSLVISWFNSEEQPAFMGSRAFSHSWEGSDCNSPLWRNRCNPFSCWASPDVSEEATRNMLLWFSLTTFCLIS